MSSLENPPAVSSSYADQASEVVALRNRVAELERQLIEVEDWANRTVAAAQERVYWLDRWGIDLNRVMERPAAGKVRALMRALRDMYRVWVALKRRLRGE